MESEISFKVVNMEMKKDDIVSFLKKNSYNAIRGRDIQSIDEKIKQLEKKREQMLTAVNRKCNHAHDKIIPQLRKYLFAKFPKLKEELLKIVYDRGGQLLSINGEQLYDRCFDFLINGLCKKIQTKEFQYKKIICTDCLVKDDLAITFKVEGNNLIERVKEIDNDTALNLYNTARIKVWFIHIVKDKDGEEELEYLESSAFTIASIPCVDDTFIYE